MSRIRTAARRTGRLFVNLGMLVVLLGSAAFVVPTFFGYDRYVITTGSMTGTYDPGSIVFDKPVPVSSLRAGDVITYMPPPESGIPHLVTHRIVHISHPANGHASFRTQGDANPQRDPWTFQLGQRTQAEVKYSVPYAGRLFLALADRQTRMLFVGGPAVLLALRGLVELVGAVRSRRRAGKAATTPQTSTWTPTQTPTYAPARRNVLQTH